MSQIKIVKGNDAPIQWRVSYQGQPLDLTGKAVTLYVINSRGPFQLKSFEVEGNVVTATYYGADQTRFGEHSLVLRLNEGRSGMSTVAVKEAFELVEWSKDQGGESGEPIKVTPIILEADVAVAPRADVDLSNYYTKDEANAAFQPKGNYQPAGNYASTSELTELSTEVSGLSEDVANKQDEIADLETIRSGASKGATAIQEVKTINGQSIVGSGNITIEGGGGSADLTAVAKWGVLTQTLKQVGNATDGYRVEVSAPQYGWIPQSFIDEIVNFGGVATNTSSPIINKPIFNATTGYFEYQGIVNLAYDEMRAAYAMGRNMFSNGTAFTSLLAIIYRPNLERGVNDKLRCILHYPTFSEMGYYRFHNFCTFLKFLEIGIVNQEFGKLLLIDEGVSYSFRGCYTLRECGYFNVTQVKTIALAFTENPSLEKVYLNGLKVNLNLGASPLFKEECILYMIEKASATGITITLHPTAYDRAMANEEIVAAMESKQVNLAKA